MFWESLGVYFEYLLLYFLFFTFIGTLAQYVLMKLADRYNLSVFQELQSNQASIDLQTKSRCES